MECCYNHLSHYFVFVLFRCATEMEFINQENYLCLPGCGRCDPVCHWLTGLEYNKIYGKRYHYNYNG